MIMRLFTGADGQSHFEELSLPAPGCQESQLQQGEGINFRRQEPGFFIDWHPAPRRQWVITLSGMAEIGIGDGTFKRFGPGDAMFRTINRANGEIFITCLSDEELLPHAVSWGVRQLMSHPEAGAVYGDHYNIDIEGNYTGFVAPQEWDYAKVLCSEFIPPFCTSFFRRTAFEAIGLKTYTDCGEFEIWIRLGAKFPVVYVPGLVAKYGVHEGELSFQSELIEEQARGKLKVLEKFFGIFLIGGIQSCITGRPDPGCSVQGLDNQAGIIGNSRQPQDLGGKKCFFISIFIKGIPVFHHRWNGQCG